MPYIKSNDGRRESLKQGDIARTAGELNYQIFYHVKCVKENTIDISIEKIKLYVAQFIGLCPNYQRYNDLTGALIRCGIEIKRRLNIDANFLIDILKSYDEEIANYEDLKIAENGDV